MFLGSQYLVLHHRIYNKLYKDFFIFLVNIDGVWGTPCFYQLEKAQCSDFYLSNEYKLQIETHQINWYTIIFAINTLHEEEIFVFEEYLHDVIETTYKIISHAYKQTHFFIFHAILGIKCKVPMHL